MTNQEAYARGFCKAAEAAGVDPVYLIKYAKSGSIGSGPLKGDAARKAVQALYDRGYITEQYTPWTTRFVEWLKGKIPGTAHWQYASNNPGLISILNEQGATRATIVPSRLRTAQVLEKYPNKMTYNDWGALNNVKAHRPISASAHSQMMDAIERANPEAAARHGYNTVGKTAPKGSRVARGVTDALSEGVASGKVKLPAATKAAPGVARAARTARAARLGRIFKFFRR